MQLKGGVCGCGGGGISALCFPKQCGLSLIGLQKTWGWTGRSTQLLSHYRCDSACRANSGSCRWSAPCRSVRAHRKDKPLVPGLSRIPSAQTLLHIRHKHSEKPVYIRDMPEDNPITAMFFLLKEIVQIIVEIFGSQNGFGGQVIWKTESLCCFLVQDEGFWD